MPPFCDKNIIDKCGMLKEDCFPTFLTDGSKKSLQAFIAKFNADKNIPPEKVDGFRELWKDLLSDAITYLKFKDKREYPDARGDNTRDKIAFGTDKLFKYFKEYQDFEALLYGSDRFYRDHILHVFRVWVLGLWLIKKFNKEISWDLKDKSPRQVKCRPSFDETMAMWCVIALTHDLGYPLDKVKKVKTQINGMMAYFGGNSISEGDFQIPTHHHFINDFILRFISSKLVEIDEKPGESGPSPEDEKNNLKTAIQSKFYLKFSKSFEKFDHGIISCIVLMKNLIYFLESDFDLNNPFPEHEDARQFYIRREILRAIACHTCTDIYHIYPNTLSFILILADELQTWGRPTFAELKSGRQKIEVKVTSADVSAEKIEIIFDTEEDVEEYFLNMCQKWHKLLRSALKSGKRKFEFRFMMKMKDKKGKEHEHLFTCKRNNQISYSLDGKEKGIEELYKIN